jgi:single-strand DNA-binding protein
MANLNKVLLIGRLTRDPEAILEGKGAKFGFAVNNRKLNQDTGEWEDVPVFIDMEIWNRGEAGKQAERLLSTVKKGQQIFIEGHLKLDVWLDKNDGAKRSALRVVVENFQYLQPRDEGESSSPSRTATRPGRRASTQAATNGAAQRSEAPSQAAGSEDDISF